MAVSQAQFERQLMAELTEAGFEFSRNDIKDILDITGNTVKGLLKDELAAHNRATRAAKKNGVERVPNPAVVVRGLGRYTVRSYPARMGRNPQTGEKLKIKASKKMQVKAHKFMRDALGVK